MQSNWQVTAPAGEVEEARRGIESARSYIGKFDDPDLKIAEVYLLEAALRLDRILGDAPSTRPSATRRS